MASYDYFLHYVRRLQENNFDCLTILSGPKGSGKSSTAIFLTMKYNDMFGFVCPFCGVEFYKNVYAIKKDELGQPKFYIPDYVKNDKCWIQCPENKELDLRTGQKKIVSGCGHKFKYSQRKKIKFSSERFIAYNNDDVIKKIFTLPLYSCLLCDEAVQFASSMDFAKTESKELKKLFTVIRPKRFWVFMNCPEIGWLDSKYREGMSSFWLRMIDRGDAVLFEKDKGVTKDSWHLDEITKLLGVVKFFSNMAKIKKNLMKHPCYFDSFHFPELPEDVYNDYEMVRNAVNLQQKVAEQSFSNKDLGKVAAYNLLNNWDRISVGVQRSRDLRLGYDILTNEIFADPLTRKRMVSDVTVRNWVRGIGDYVKSKGEKAVVFDTAKDEVVEGPELEVKL